MSHDLGFRFEVTAPRAASPARSLDGPGRWMRLRRGTLVMPDHVIDHEVEVVGISIAAPATSSVHAR